MAILKTVNASKQYDGYSAIVNLNLEIQKGEIYCLLGQNGAGKTTTINLFLGFTAPTSGTLFINGEKVETVNNTTKKMVAYIP